MKILFLLLQMPDEGKGDGMYLNLIEEFRDNGHDITVMAPDNEHKNVYMHQERGLRVLRVNSKATQNVGNMIKKGLALATLPFYYKRAYKKYLDNEKFDWIFMPTPPITLVDFVDYAKRKSGANFYLILRDIHPQSVASIGLIKHKFMYDYLAKRAYKGYILADKIGCMSQGNIDFIQENYPNLPKTKLVLLYNWLKSSGSDRKTSDIRAKYNLKGKFVAIFGGTIGKGQRIENISYLAEHYLSNENIVFLIIGRGVEKERLEEIARQKQLKNIIFLNYMPQEDYLNMIKSADLGLITINERYKVPTCPSKAVSYMSLGIPILAMINPNSDYGLVIEKAGAGYWSVGSDKDKTVSLFDKLYSDAELRKSMGDAGRLFYQANCTPSVAYNTIISQIQNL